MKTTFKTSLALAAACLAVAGSVHAQGSMSSGSGSGYSIYAPGSTYIGFNAGQSNFRLNGGNGSFANEQRKTSYSLYGGGYFNDYLGVEAGYTDFGRINRAGGQTRADAFSVSLIGKLPLTPAFNLLGRVGTSYSRTNVSSNMTSGVTPGNQTDLGLSYGIGAEYAFNSQLSGVLEYDEYNMKFAGGNRDRINTTSLGLRYKF